MKILWGAALAALCLASAPAMAATDDTDDDQARDPDRQDVVVTAELATEQGPGTALFGTGAPRDLPFSISVIDADQLHRQLPRNISEALITEPAVTNSYGGSGGYPTESFNIRGFELGGGDSFLVDGMPIAGQVTQSLDNKERIEVLLGPAAFRFGFLPPGGAINMISKMPTDEPLARVGTRLDNWGFWKVNADVGGRIGDGTVGYRINASFADQQTFVEPIHSDRYFISGVFDFRLGEGLKLTLSADHFKSDIYGDMFHYVRPTLSGKILTGIGPRDYWGQRWANWFSTYSNASARVDADLTPWLKLASTTSWFLQEQRTTLTIPERVQDNGDFRVFESRGAFRGEKWANTTFLQADLGNETTLRNQITAGVTYRNLDNRNPFPTISADIGGSNFYRPTRLSPSPLQLGPMSPLSRQKELGAFVSDQITLGGRWHGLIGLRYSRYDVTRFLRPTTAVQDQRVRSAVTPMFGLMADVTPQIRLYASHAKGLELGGIAPANAGNPGEIQPPVKSSQIEGGVKGLFVGGRLGVDLAVFRIEKDSEFLDPATNLYGPLGLQRHKGGELRVYGRPVPRLYLSGGVQYIDAKLVRTVSAATLGDTPFNTPEWSGVVNADLGIGSGLFVNGLVKHVGSRQVAVPNTALTPGYTRVDLGLRHEGVLGGRNVTVRAQVENLADEFYYIASWSNLLEFGAPRTFTLSMDVAF